MHGEAYIKHVLHTLRKEHLGRNSEVFIRARVQPGIHGKSPRAGGRLCFLSKDRAWRRGGCRGHLCTSTDWGEAAAQWKRLSKRCCRKWRVEMSQDHGVGLCEQPTWAHSSFAPSCELRGRGGRRLLARGGRKRGRTGNETLTQVLRE